MVVPFVRRVLVIAAAACALGTVVAAQASDALDARIRNALDQARPALLNHLKDVAAKAGCGGELALLCLCGLHDGIDPKQPVLAAALKELLQIESGSLQTYDLSLRLLVLDAWPDAPDREKVAKADCQELLQHRTGGGFTYSRTGGGAGRWDLSNTQYAALGLRAARALGCTVAREVWTTLADTVIAAQSNYGGWGYGPKSGNRVEPYASMTVAGIAVLAICKQALETKDNHQPELDKHVQRGWVWMEKNKDAIGSTELPWITYFHYGLERAAILTDVVKVGAVDWYRTGAEMLCGMQLTGGGWSERAGTIYNRRTHGEGDSVATSFAILFLRRKFQKFAGAVTPRVVTLAMLTPKATPEDVQVCVDGLQRRGRDAGKDILLALRSDVLPQREAAVKALQALAGSDFGYDAKKDADGNRDALRQAELWYLKAR